MNHAGFRAEGRVKKIPSLRIEDWGFSPACTLHSLILEDHSVKNIQAGFLTPPPL